MRKRDIKIGDAYAVNGSQRHGEVTDAVRATVVSSGPEPGLWRVRFDEEMVMAGRLRPARDDEGAYDFRTKRVQPRPRFLEHTVSSWDILAPWDKHVTTRREEKERARALKERLEGEQERLTSLCEEIGTLLAERGLEAQAPAYVAGMERSWPDDEPLSRGKLLLSEEILAYVKDAVLAAPVKEGQAALASLVAPFV